jgi:hypothetical protein
MTGHVLMPGRSLSTKRAEQLGIRQPSVNGLAEDARGDRYRFLYSKAHAGLHEWVRSYPELDREYPQIWAITAKPVRSHRR